MTFDINGSRGGTADGNKPITFDKAEDLGAFELASLWADRPSWPWPTDRDAYDELAELACMSALARWLARWQPIHIHKAVPAGAEPKAVADALGGSIADAVGCWHAWALQQRSSVICGRPGVTAEEYETVMAAFAAAGVTVPAEEAHP